MADSWTIQDDLLDSEDSDWSKSNAINQKDEDAAWRSKTTVLNPNVSNNKFGTMGFGGYAVEELREFPEDIDIFPEEIQADSEGWTVLSEPE